MPQFDLAQMKTGEDATHAVAPAPAAAPEMQAPAAEAVVPGEPVTLTETVGAHEPAAKSTMPQLNFDTFASQIFWLVLTFTVLYFMLSRILLPKIHLVLENRQSKIAHDIDRAEKLQLEAEEARQSYEKALKASREKAQALIGESAALMEKSSAARHAELDAKLEKQLASAEANISVAKEQALARLAPVAKELTQEIVEKLTGQKLQASDVGNEVDRLIRGKNAG